MRQARFFSLFSIMLNLVAIFVLVGFVKQANFGNSLDQNDVDMEKKTESDRKEVLSETSSVSGEIHSVVRVIDGDTIALENGKVVRYVGIDAPEKSSETSSECFSENAASANKELVEGKKVLLKSDVSEKDRYGRLLRYVWTVNDAGGKKNFVNKQLVDEGYAKAVSSSPDVMYDDVFRLAEIDAKEAQLGLWGQCYP